MKKQKLLLTLFSIVFMHLAAQAQNCKPLLRYYVNRFAASELHVNKSDTLDVFIDCLELCDILVEAEGVNIEKLVKGKFLLTALSVGEKKVSFYSQCPKGKKLTISGKKTDMSGRQFVGEERFTCID